MAKNSEMVEDAVEETTETSAVLSQKARAELLFISKRSNVVLLNAEHKLVELYDELSAFGLMTKSTGVDAEGKTEYRYDYNKKVAEDYLKSTRSKSGRDTTHAVDADPSQAQLPEKAKWLPEYLAKGYLDTGLRVTTRAEAAEKAKEIRAEKRNALVVPLTHKCFGVMATPEGMEVSRTGARGSSLDTRIKRVLSSDAVDDTSKAEIEDMYRQLKELTATAESAMAEASDQDEDNDSDD